MIGHSSSARISITKYYLSNVPILPLGGKFKTLTFHIEQQNLPEVRRLVFKMLFHSYSSKSEQLSSPKFTKVQSSASLKLP